MIRAWPLLLAFLFHAPLLPAFTFTNNIGATFAGDEVSIYVAANSDCTNAGTSKEEILSQLGPAISEFWNTVTTSRLKLNIGGIYQTDNDLFNTGVLCNQDLDSTCTGAVVPEVDEIVIACNNNTTDNFTSTGVYALTLSNHFEGTTIAGSVILINNVAGSAYASLDSRQKIAVLAHEIGHAIGLGHSQFGKNLMYFTLVADRTALGQDDVDGMSFLYPLKGDGCGFFGTIASSDKDHRKKGLFDFLFYFLIGLLLSTLILLKKRLFKL